MTTQLAKLVLQEQVQSGEELEKVVGGIPGEVAIILGGYLMQHVYFPKKTGRIFGANTDFEFPGVGKRQPDIAFVSLERLPQNTFDTVPLVPDLAVEVISKTDATYVWEDKVKMYLQTGVKLVWVVRPNSEVVEVYRPGDEKPTVLGVSDELDGEDVIPGFKLPIRALFE